MMCAVFFRSFVPTPSVVSQKAAEGGARGDCAAADGEGFGGPRQKVIRSQNSPGRSAAGAPQGLVMNACWHVVNERMCQPSGV
eukprot:209434-Prymnesium_polylepis.1